MLAPDCPMCARGRGELLTRMGDEREYRCGRCGHVWVEMDDPDDEFTGMF